MMNPYSWKRQFEYWLFKQPLVQKQLQIGSNYQLVYGLKLLFYCEM